jgi:hypothetical protein
MGDEMTAERKAIEEARWKRGESHLCLGCGRLPPHQGCAAICPACTPPNGTCDCAGCSLASAQALKAIGERDALRQAHWDARAAAGFDNDGDPTPRAVASDFAALIRSDWRSMQESLDESRAESDAAESALASAREALKAADAAMNHMGDVLNEMDAVEPEDEEKTGPAFALVRIALGEPMDGDEERALKATAPTGGVK